MPQRRTRRELRAAVRHRRLRREQHRKCVRPCLNLLSTERSLRDSVVFKEVVPIQDATIRAKIHQTYRIGYLKDVILPRVLDDATFGTLTSIMLFNNVEVVLALQAGSHVPSRSFLRGYARRRALSRSGTTSWVSFRSCAR